MANTSDIASSSKVLYAPALVFGNLLHNDQFITPLAAAFVGISAIWLLLSVGRVAGISGILWGRLRARIALALVVYGWAARRP